MSIINPQSCCDLAKITAPSKVSIRLPTSKNISAFHHPPIFWFTYSEFHSPVKTRSIILTKTQKHP